MIFPTPNSVEPLRAVGHSAVAGVEDGYIPAPEMLEETAIDILRAPVVAGFGRGDDYKWSVVSASQSDELGDRLPRERTAAVDEQGTGRGADFGFVGKAGNCGQQE